MQNDYTNGDAENTLFLHRFFLVSHQQPVLHAIPAAFFHWHVFLHEHVRVSES